MSKFEGKVVIITGASSGIGSETALYFAKLGASLVLCGRNVENLNKICENCAKTGNCPQPLIVISEVTDDNSAELIVQSTLKKFGKIDILVNNVGILHYDSIETVNINKFDELFNVNVRSVIKLTNAAVQHLIAAKGNIVNVSSVAGVRAFPGCLSYCLSKAALDQFTKCIALDLAQKNVRVNSVNPGVIVTDIHRRSGMEDQAYQNYLEHSKTTHAMGRVGQVSEVAAAIGFLASDDASFITGVNLSIDGGKHAMCPR